MTFIFLHLNLYFALRRLILHRMFEKILFNPSFHLLQAGIMKTAVIETIVIAENISTIFTW